MSQLEFDYMKEAARTASGGNFHGEMIEGADFSAVCNRAISTLNELDGIKKTLFYGRNVGFHVRNDAPTVSSLPAWLSGGTGSAISKQQAIEIVHGVIGIATEAGELLDMLMDAVNENGAIDVVNIREEIGDVFWYAALLLNAVGSDFEEAQRRNIEKLRHRFPNKFTEEAANVRDLEGERKILEKVEKDD